MQLAVKLDVCSWYIYFRRTWQGSKVAQYSNMCYMFKCYIQKNLKRVIKAILLSFNGLVSGLFHLLVFDEYS